MVDSRQRQLIQPLEGLAFLLLEENALIRGGQQSTQRSPRTLWAHVMPFKRACHRDGSCSLLSSGLPIPCCGILCCLERRIRFPPGRIRRIRWRAAQMLGGCELLVVCGSCVYLEVRVMNESPSGPLHRSTACVQQGAGKANKAAAYS
jgi:hypothetical protein